MAEQTLIGHTTIEDRFEEQKRLGADDDKLFKWLDREIIASGGFGTFTSAEMVWILDKLDELLK